jgi:hypothetical protein
VNVGVLPAARTDGAAKGEKAATAPAATSARPRDFMSFIGGYCTIGSSAWSAYNALAEHGVALLRGFSRT